MSIVEPRTLSGFMELLPPDQIKMERLMEVLRRTYSVYGFTPLDTPVIESSEVLLAKGGGETEKQVYRFQKGDSDLSLRFDLTVPLAKYVALHYNDLTFPFRRYQIGKVYRGERAQRGRFREFYQADIDVIGDGKLDIVNEAEIPAIIYRTFTELGLKNFKIHINNRKLLNGFYDMNGMLSRASLIMRTVDKLDKIGPEKVREILMSPEVGMYAQKADSVLEFTAVKGDNEDVFRYLEQMRGTDAQYDEGLDELHTIVQCLEDLGVPQENYTIDLSIARGLDYYTGTVYETIITSHPEIGSVCSGGRYDNLALRYHHHVSLRRSGNPYDGRPQLRHDGGCPVPSERYPHPVLCRAEEVQGEDELCGQTEGALCRDPRRGRGGIQRLQRQEHAHR